MTTVSQEKNYAVGGYFELELFNKLDLNSPPNYFSTVRSALKFIIDTELGRGSVGSLILPNLICPEIPNFLKKNFPNLKARFYSVDENLRPVHIPCDERDIILYLNLFGLSARWTPVAPRVIIDNTHSFYEPLNDKHPSIVSIRKYFGTPDGAILHNYDVSQIHQRKNVWGLIDHMISRKEFGPELGYKGFLNYEKNLSLIDRVENISFLSEAIFNQLDHDFITKRRRDNFIIFHEKFGKINQLSDLIDAVDPTSSPYTYPLLIDNGSDLRTSLIRKRIYVPTLWKNISGVNLNQFELHLIKNCVHLPIDQRYDHEDMLRVAQTILESTVIRQAKLNQTRFG